VGEEEEEEVEEEEIEEEYKVSTNMEEVLVVDFRDGLWEDLHLVPSLHLSDNNNAVLALA